MPTYKCLPELLVYHISPYQKEWTNTDSDATEVLKSPVSIVQAPAWEKISGDSKEV